MSKIQVPSRDQVSPGTQVIFDNLQKKIGMVPNLYATIGHSENALSSYLEFAGALSKGTFNAKEREAVFLAVSEVNACEYCLAAHTAIGKMSGYTEEDTLALRAGTIADPKLSILTRLSADITRKHGRPDEALVDEFFNLGYNEAALIDLIALVAEKTFANYVNNLSQTPVDFPAVKPLEVAA